MTMLARDKIMKDMNCYDIGEDKIEYISARELLVSSRIDLVAKYKFVEAYDKGMNIPFVQELYYAHLEAFTGGRFVEPGKENTKKSFQDYLVTFKQLIDSIKRDGIKKEISVIPVGKNNIILNGSHRVAIAMYYDLTIPIIRYDDIEVKYDYHYFKINLLERRYLDYMATEYIRLKENVFFACIWPRADKNKRENVDKIIIESCNVVYNESVLLGHNGLKNLMIQIYGKQEWCGSIQNGYKGIQGKVDDCYEEGSETIIYILDNTELDSVISLKQKIRNIYQIENSSVHISDNSKESLDMARLLLNHNSIDALNYGRMCRYKNYIMEIQQIGEALDRYQIDREDFLIDSSGVLGIYGIRSPGDIDCLTMKKMNQYPFSVKVEVHDKYILYYAKTKEELLYNPDNYLFAYGVKFNSLATLFEMKKRRNEKKDYEDCLLIKLYLEKQMTYRAKINQYKVRLKKQCRNICKKMKNGACTFLKTVHLYTVAEKMYRLFKRI